MMYWLKNRLRREDKGAVLVEFTLLLPIILLLFVGIYDVSNLISCSNKLNQTAQELSNVITRGKLTKPQLDAILRAAPLLMQPFDFSTNGKVIVTCVTQASTSSTPPPPTSPWQDSYGSGAGTTQINLSNLPGGLVLTSGQTVIFTEAFYTYTGDFTTYSFTSGKLYQIAAGMPRQGTMTTLPQS